MFYIHIQYTKSHILSHVVPTFFASAPTPLFELQAFIFGWLCQKQPYLKDTHYVGTFTSIEHLELIIIWVKRHNMSALGCKHILCILTIYVKCEVYFYFFYFLFIFFLPFHVKYNNIQPKHKTHTYLVRLVEIVYLATSFAPSSSPWPRDQVSVVVKHKQQTLQIMWKILQRYNCSKINLWGLIY